MLLFLTSLLTISCTSFKFQSKELIKIKMGLSSKQVLDLIANDKSAQYVRYNYDYTKKVNIPNTKNKYTIIFGWKSDAMFYNRYICAFENDKLIYWGTLLEFARHKSPLINQIGEEIAKQIKEYFPKPVVKLHF